MYVLSKADCEEKTIAQRRMSFIEEIPTTKKK
jgi:hypothetical protein